MNYLAECEFSQWHFFHFEQSIKIVMKFKGEKILVYARAFLVRLNVKFW
jgi:hypothetical protein